MPNKENNEFSDEHDENFTSEVEQKEVLVKGEGTANQNDDFGLGVDSAAQYSENELFLEVVEILERTEHTEGKNDIKKESKIESNGEGKTLDTLLSEVSLNDEEVEGYLEEKYYEPTTTGKDGFSIGDVITLGDKDFVVDEVLARELYKAHIENTELDTFMLISTKPRSPLWSKLPPQRLLPEIIYEGDDGYVLTWIEGEVLEPKLSWQDALEHLNPLAQLLRFFAAQEIAVYDIDPNGLILTEQGLKLRYPLQIAKIGEEVALAPRDSFTPTEVQVNKVVGNKTGIYLWGAILYYLYKGEPVPVEGLDPVELSNFKDPGLPQIFYATLSPIHNRIDAATLQRRIKSLQSPQRPVFVVAAATTIGLAPERELNEDSYGFVQHTLETFEGPQQIIRACIADGMGGEVAGELASQAAVKAFCEATPLSDLARPQVQVDWSVELAWKANEAVLNVLDDNGGGCTFTSVILVNERLTLAHVGDSRAYLYHPDNGLQLLTCDHSLVKAMIDQGVISEAEAEDSPDAHKVIRSLGARRQHQEGDSYVDTLASLTDENAQPIFKETRDIEAEEVVLLMSDGVWGVWGHKESIIEKRLTEVIKSGYTAQQIADNLVKAALEEDAPDNATVVVVKRLR